MDVPAPAPFEKSDWEAIIAAFHHAPSLTMSQAWREKPEENLRPGCVKLGWQKGSLLVFARLTDDRVFTTATKDNDLLWKMGDVFEMFLRDSSRPEYLELHIAPNGRRLQLRFPDSQAIGRLRDGNSELKDYMVEESLFDFSARKTLHGWEVFAEVPLVSLGSTGDIVQGASVTASFSRYDYIDEKTPPVLSSTSEHKELNYHRQHEWKQLNLTA
jgi:hypothetical protein